MRYSIFILLLLTSCAKTRTDSQAVTHDTGYVNNNAKSAAPNAAATPGGTSSAGAASNADGSSSAMDSSSAATETAHWKTYTNNTYHFSFQYPSDLRTQIPFHTYDLLTSQWRAMATPAEPGKAIISVPIVRLTGRTSYPRFYDVEFRIGIADSLGPCRATNGERTIGTTIINGATFNQFVFSDAAMMKYVKGISYRTGHNGKCYAIEQIATGSNYRDAASKSDIPQSELDQYYYLAGKIVKTFRFTK